MPQLSGRTIETLLFIAWPAGLESEKSRTDLEGEMSALSEAPCNPQCPGNVEIDPAQYGTLATLQGRLDRQAYHCLHLSTHGSTKDVQAWLLFEKECDLRSEPIGAETLIGLLTQAKCRPPRIVLSACRTAGHPRK